MFLCVTSCFVKALVTLETAEWFGSCVNLFMLFKGSCCIESNRMVSLLSVLLHVLSELMLYCRQCVLCVPTSCSIEALVALGAV